MTDVKTLAERQAETEEHRQAIVRQLLKDNERMPRLTAHEIANSALYALACGGWEIERNRRSL